MVLQVSGILSALQHVATKTRVVNFSKRLESLPKGMSTVLRINLSEVVIFLNQAATIPLQESKEEDKSVAYTVATIQCITQELREN